MLVTMRQSDPPKRMIRSGVQRTIAVVAAIAAVLVLFPALRILLQPGPLQSTFSTVATLAQFGLTSDVRGRDLTPDETETRRAEILRTELEQQPKDPVARLNLAAQLLTNRQLDEARALIQAVLETRPQDPQILNALALVQIAAEEPQTAILTLQKAVAFNPLFAPAAFNLADLLVEQNRPEEAITVLRQALQRPLPADAREQLRKRLDALSVSR
jgi:tetratricopeptide (TPR) repeat protein